MLVLLIDIGLAAAGVVLLREGLREAPATNGSGSGSSTAAGAQVEPAPHATDPPGGGPSPAATEVVAQTPPPPPAQDQVLQHEATPTPTPDAKHREDPPTRARTQKIHVTNRKPGGGSGSGPVDPYGGETEPAVSLATQVDRLFVHSKPAFDGCYTAIAKSLPPDAAPRGTIKIAFRVAPDGRVERVIAVENGTGSEPLSGCLITEIGAWVLPAHGGDGVDFVRAVNF
jgi:outer membrane biosynthesis protein TonB